MTLELPPALEQELKSLAIESQRSPNEIAEEALASFISSRKQRLALIRQGEEDFARGDFFTSEEVHAHIEEMFASR
jgi:predicted transcriptional regulator